MNIELCNFSGQKIYPGRGKTFVKTDNRTFKFINGKCESHFLGGRRPLKFLWTVFYRRTHKKDVVSSVAKKKTKRVAKAIRAISGVSLEVISEKRAESQQFRRGQSQMQLQKAKEKRKLKEENKEKEKNLAKQASTRGTGQIPSTKGKTKTPGGKIKPTHR